MGTQSNRRPGTWLSLFALFALAVFGLSFTVVATPQHEPPPAVIDSTVDQPNARVTGEVIEEQGICPKKTESDVYREKPSPEPAPAGACAAGCGSDTAATWATGSPETEVIYRLGHMFHDPDEYLGKTITVDGEMHRQFTERVFTIEDDGMFRDHDMLVISLTPMTESVIPLQDSFDRGKNVRVTGVLRPYDRAKLECLYGPLNLESREGKSFTKNPVLIIGYRPPAPAPRAAAVYIPSPVEPRIEAAAPAPAPEPQEEVAELVIEPAPAAPAMAAVGPTELPRTASNLPFVALAGVLSLSAALSARLRGRKVHNK